MVAWGMALEQPQKLQEAPTEAFSHDGHALIDVVSARQELVMPRKPTLDQARQFSLFLIKAVLNGRAGEVVDLAKVNFNR
jgi:pyruvate dehydrogenase (quinone)